jgi:hypothetical protein
MGKKFIREGVNDFDWAKDINPLSTKVGVKYKTPNGNIITLKRIVYDKYVLFSVHDSNGNILINNSEGLLSDFKDYVDNGTWEVVSSMNESNDFGWITDIPSKSPYRYFEIYACWNSFYDEETGEDECTDGGSYFVKIPEDVVDEIWDYTAEDQYYAGPGDEGEGVIVWCVENNLINGDDVDMFEYVTELSETDYCNAWGNFQDEESCGGNLQESNDFDWISDIEELPIPGTAWIMEINPKDSEEAQQKLFDVGFRWSSGGNKIVETSGVYAFVSYSNYDIKYKGFKMVKGDSYISNHINNIIRSVQPNDLFIYEYKDGTSRLKNTSLNESNDFDWISDIDAKLPTLGELFDDGRLEVDDVITLRGEVINGRNWKKKWFNAFVIKLTSKGERLTSGTFFDLIDTPINNGVSESMGLSDDFEVSFIDGDEKLEVLGVVRNGKEMDLFKLNESTDFDWVKGIDVTPIDNGPICEALYGEVVRYFRNKQPISYGDYYYSMDEYNGTIVWGFNDTDEYVVYATPYWNECELNIDIQGDMGDYETIDYIELPKFEYVEALHQWLENEYPKIVVKRIKSLGPLPE